ncbi:MAG: NAD(P)/FAD-dependent oxidoreductase [Sphingobium sp.]
MSTKTPESTDRSQLESDMKALRAKYREERDKRIRSDGNAQYRAPAGDLSHYAEDPDVERLEREPLHDSVDVVIVGGGFGGLLAGARLRQAGVERIRIIDAAADVGGTWYWNRYPGARCDIEAYIYMPMLEEVGTMPTEKYARRSEIFAHAQAMARKFDLYRDACLQTSVTGMEWDEEGGQWIVSTNRGDRIRATYVVMSIGYLHRPKLPAIPGIETFEGHSFHASRWDYDYTGGEPEDWSLPKLADKRVGVVGTGATAIQCIPYLANACEHLYVFQRTPSVIGLRGNRPTDTAWVESLEPGWQKKRLDNFHTLTSGGTAEEDLVDDGWTDITSKLAAILPKSGSAQESDPKQLAYEAELADFAYMEFIRGRVDELVEDPATAAALKPYYRTFCKRPLFHDEYLQTFNQPNVTLVNTEGRGIERIEGKSAIIGDNKYELDCLVLASGFESEYDTPYMARTGFDIIGREGRSLSSSWADGMRTLHGMHTHGFPNLFIVSRTQSALQINAPFMLNEQALHIAYIIRSLRERNATIVEATQEAEAEWVQTILDLAVHDLEFLNECTPGLLNNEGAANRRNLQNTSYGGGSIKFLNLWREWREANDLAGLRVYGAGSDTEN